MRAPRVPRQGRPVQRLPAPPSPFGDRGSQGSQSGEGLPPPPRPGLQPARRERRRRAGVLSHLHNGGWSHQRAERRLRERGRSTARRSAEEPRGRALPARRFKGTALEAAPPPSGSRRRVRAVCPAWTACPGWWGRRTVRSPGRRLPPAPPSLLG